MNIWIVIVLILQLNVFYTTSKDIKTLTTLYSNLITGYNKHVPPVPSNSAPIYTNITFYLINIHEFDEVSGKFSVTGFLNIFWVDPRLAYNYWYYRTYSIYFPQNKVWKPELILINPYDKIASFGTDTMNVRVFSNGVANWSPGDVLSSSCSIDVTYYPFDVQTCEMIMMIWGVPKYEVTLLSSAPEADYTFFSPHGLWDLKSTSTVAVNDGYFSSYKVSIKMKRRPTFFLVNVVLPILFMGVLNMFVFILPVESGERVSYAITCLLAIAVFLTLVGDNLPKTSKPMSILCYFLMFDLVMSSLICLVTIIGLKIHHIDPEENKVPRWLENITRCILCRRRRNDNIDKSNQKDNKVDDVPQKIETLNVPKLKTNLSKGTARRMTVKPAKEQNANDIFVVPDKKHLPDMTGIIVHEVNVDESDDDRPIVWTSVNRAFDRIMMVLCLLWIVLVVLIFFSTVVLASESAHNNSD